MPLNVTGGSVAAAYPVGAVLKEAARDAASQFKVELLVA